MTHKTLTIDPGETVGWSIWEAGELLESGQHPLQEFADALYIAWGLWPEDASRPSGIDSTLTASLVGTREVVCENWRLYPGKLQQLAWDECRTARLIGRIEQACRMREYAIFTPGADIKSAAKAAGAEELFVEPLHENRHQNDAIMHGTHFFRVGAGKDRV